MRGRIPRCYTACARLDDLIEGDGGPLMWPRITELEQHSLDATGRKLHRFWHESAAGKTPG